MIKLKLSSVIEVLVNIFVFKSNTLIDKPVAAIINFSLKLLKIVHANKLYIKLPF